MLLRSCLAAKHAVAVLLLAAPLAGCTTTTNDANKGTASAADSGEDGLQNDLLADGRVTPSEMEQALAAVTECIEAAGFSARFSLNDDASYSSEISGGSNLAEDPARDAANAQCQSRYLSRTYPQFAKEYGPSKKESDERDASSLACLQDRGYDIAGRELADVALVVDAKDFADCTS